jgi:4-amino-4-deoxy-L-arabinose transferase-like glycosyltransferase
MIKFFSKLKPIHWLLIAILAIGSFLRLYNLTGSMMFLGDQGRDAIIVKRIFTDFDPVFIGPVTSVGNMYLGPLYYYFMLPWLRLTYPSPVGPAYAVAILGIITVFLMYHLGKKLVGKKAAIIGTAFFAFSSTVVNNTRFSWNPNPAPFASLCMIYFTYMAWKKNPRYWILVALFFSVLVQLHYLTLLSAAGAGVIWLFNLYDVRKHKVKLKKLLVSTLIAFILFVGTLTPIILFDLKHDNLNAKGFSQMITGEDNFTQNEKVPFIEKATTIVKETHGRGMHILFEISIGKERQLNTWLLVFTLIILAALGINHKKFHLKNDNFYGETVVLVYLFTGIIGTSFYGHTIFDHYISYLFPVTFLTFGIVIAAISSKSFLAKVLSMIFFFYFVFFNINRYSLSTQNWSVDDVRRTAETIIEKAKVGEKYNIVLLSGTGDIDGQSYRYFLETSDKPPVKTENRGEVETLFIINEDQKIDNVTNSPIYEIVVFPDKDIKEVYNIENGPEITILRKN